MPLDIVRKTQQILNSGQGELMKVLPAYIDRVITDEAWVGRQSRRDGEFTSFQAFVEHPLPEGLGTTIADLLSYCRREPKVQTLLRSQVPELAEHGGDREDQGSNTTLPFQNRSATYIIGRLKRDHPDLAEKVVNGELSANQAAIEAGIRKQRVYITDDAERAAMQIRNKFGDGYVEQLITCFGENREKGQFYE